MRQLNYPHQIQHPNCFLYISIGWRCWYYSIKVRVVDNEGVYKVDFYLNQDLVGTDFSPMEIYLNMNGTRWRLIHLNHFLRNAFHYLSFVASDINDNDCFLCDKSIY